MLRKALCRPILVRIPKPVGSIIVALFTLSLLIGLVAGRVMAQTGTSQSGTSQTGTSQTGATQSDAAQIDEEETPAVVVQPAVAAASVVQTVPVTLTLTIPGPTGNVTVEVPVFLSLDIRIGISPKLTTTLEVTPSVATSVTTTATVEATTESTIEATTEATEESTVAAPTLAPTATQTTPAATATPIPDETEPEVEPTEAPLPTATPTATPEPVAAAPVCPDPRAVIVAPGVGQVLSGTVNILGTATHENFQYYKIEYAQGENVDPNATFSYLADARVQVTGSLLATFDSADFANGAYTLKLTVVDNSGNFPPPCTVSVVIAN